MCFVGFFLFSPVHKKEQRLWFSVVFYEVSIGFSIGMSQELFFFFFDFFFTFLLTDFVSLSFH